jgi:hypothetical protein
MEAMPDKTVTEEETTEVITNEEVITDPAWDFDNNGWRFKD